jgi:tetratricopeptide (TPR) repeat protein
LAYFNRGKAFAAKGEYDHAIDDYTKALDIEPRYLKAYLYRGIAHEKKGNTEEALEDLSTSIEIYPQNAEAYLERGLAFEKASNYDRAISDFTSVIKLKPKNHMAYRFRGRTWFYKGNYTPAIDDYRKALELDTDFVEAFKEIADMLANCSDGRSRTCSQTVAFASKIFKNRSKACKLKTLVSAFKKAGHPEDAKDLRGKISQLIQIEKVNGKNERLSDEEIAKLMAELKAELNLDDKTKEQREEIMENIRLLNTEISKRLPPLSSNNFSKRKWSEAKIFFGTLR